MNLQLKREATGHISIKAHLAHSHLHTHLRVFVHCRCIIFLLRKHSACLRKLYPFQIVNLSLIRPAVLPNIPGVVHFPSPPVWSWVRVCRGVRGASSRGRQRCSGGCLDTLISILNWSHTVWLRRRAKHLGHLWRQCGHRYLQYCNDMPDCALSRDGNDGGKRIRF